GDRAEGEVVRATGTDGAAARTVAPPVAPGVAPTADNQGARLSLSDNPSSSETTNTIAASGTADKRKGSLTIPVSEPLCRGDWIRTSDLLNPIEPGFPAHFN